MGNQPVTLKSVPQPKADTLHEESGGKFPMHVHSVDGETFKEVRSDEELAAALKDGWVRVDVQPDVNIPAEAAEAQKAKAAPKPKKK